MRSLRTIIILAILALCVQPLVGCSDDDNDTSNGAGDVGFSDRDAADDDVSAATDVTQTDATQTDTSQTDTAQPDAPGADTTDNDATQTDTTGTDVTGADTSHTDTTDSDATQTDTTEGDTADTGLARICEGVCSEQNLTVVYANTTGELTRAAFGLTAPEASDSGEWEVYLEAWEGGFEGCPVENSASPDWQFIIGGFGIPQDETTLTKADDGVFLSFLDYDGQFLGTQPVAIGDPVSITPVAVRIDTELVADGVQDEDGFIALDISATFGVEGEASGHIYAKHCASMDLLELVE